MPAVSKWMNLKLQMTWIVSVSKHGGFDAVFIHWNKDLTISKYSFHSWCRKGSPKDISSGKLGAAGGIFILNWFSYLFLYILYTIYVQKCDIHQLMVIYDDEPWGFGFQSLEKIDQCIRKIIFMGLFPHKISISQ